MKINIYWEDLSQAGKETVINGGLELSALQISEKEPIGIFSDEDKED